MGIIGGVAPGVIARPIGQPIQNIATNQITLVDGKPQTIPTDASGAVRVRLSDHLKQLGKSPEGEIHLGLQLTAEPKLQMQSVISVRIDKAVDDQNQKLSQLMNMGNQNPQFPMGGFGFGGAVPAIAPAPFGGLGFAGWGLGQSQYAAVALKKGEKAAKTIKEMTGVVTAQVLTPSEPIITADGILKAAGKSFKGRYRGRD